MHSRGVPEVVILALYVAISGFPVGTMGLTVILTAVSLTVSMLEGAREKLRCFYFFA